MAGFPAVGGEIVVAVGVAGFDTLAGFAVLAEAELGELSETVPSCARI